ncbi:MAG TPA: phosphatase PAP2 family protein [Bacteroidia bacterium]|jgi:membrane-associated phospholipid phosphatase|nr:phosphatase PAP2 family protein [Bacteroidia bacterium]
MNAGKRVIWLFLFLGIFSTPILAQQDSAHQYRSLRFNSDYIYSGILDAHDQIIAPFHWNGTQWATFGVLAGGESALIFAGGDKSIQIWAQSHRNNTMNFMEGNFGDPFGDGLYPAIIVGSAFIFGCVLKNYHLKNMAMLTAKSLVISASTTLILKSIAERHRPYQNTAPNPLLWNGPVGKLGDNSFPSGHTTVAFATATSIALAYPRPLIIPILAYSFATVTAMGRINGNFHWTSDVIMGAAIGYFTSKLIFTHDNWLKSRQKTKRI